MVEDRMRLKIKTLSKRMRVLRLLQITTPLSADPSSPLDLPMECIQVARACTWVLLVNNMVNITRNLRVTSR